MRSTVAIYIIMCMLVVPAVFGYSGLSAAGQDDGNRTSMSPYVRQAVRKNLRRKSPVDIIRKAPSATPNAGEDSGKYKGEHADGAYTQPSLLITAFVKISDGDGERLLQSKGCAVLACLDDIFIASIPLDSIATLAGEAAVERIEASACGTALMDTTPSIVNTQPVYDGEGLPQAYTGSGVVVGLQDIGFDVTHPNFYSTDMTTYRIRRFWDQLSADTAGGSPMYVGAEYTDEESIKAYGHSRDGLIETHGTHTLGIAAGTGYDKSYRGMAYGSDICIVSNAVTSDTVFISDEDIYKYTTATDALGFKYILDYADEVGSPCVISFSEGSHESFSDDEELYYEALESLVGPGKIIVASAGNEGWTKSYIHKEEGTESAGTFLSNSSANYVYIKMQSADAFTIRLKLYGDDIETTDLYTQDILNADTVSADYQSYIDYPYALDADAIYTDTIVYGDETYYIEACGYASFYDNAMTAYELYVEGPDYIGSSTPLSLEVVGAGADIEVYQSAGSFTTNSLDATLNAGEYTHNVLSPGSAPAVICVGATGYRSSYTNYNGETTTTDYGENGEIARFSSIGPTYDERIKPDVVAPGTNVISSGSSYYLASNSGDSTIFKSIVDYSAFADRTYSWFVETGTSMSTPVVAGAIALWLEADATLTPDDIKDVLSRTANHYDETLDYPNNTYGYGEIDVYAGLLDVLNLTAISEISTSHAKARIAIDGSGGIMTIAFSTAPASPFSVSVYGIDGSLILKQALQPSGSDTFSVDISALPAGIYAVQTTGTDAGVTGSTLLRLAY